MLYNLLKSIEGMSLSFLAFMEKELIYSSIIFLIVLGLMKLFKKQSPYLQYGLLGLVFIRLVLPPDFNLGISGRALIDEFNLLPAHEISTFSQPDKIVNQHQINDNKLQEKQPGAPVIATNFAPNTSYDFNYLSITVFAIWCIGVMAFVAIFFRRFLYYNRIVRTALLVEDEKHAAIVVRWCKRFSIRRNVRLVTSDKSLSPFTIGVLRPIIYIPEIILTKSSQQTAESVIAHELAHVKNYDDLWIKFQNIVQVVYFFHPVAWFANSRINEIRERICDEMVLAYEDISPKAYGRSMLDVLKMNLAGPEGVEILPGFGDHKKKFSTRIREIAGVTKIKKANFLLVGFSVLFFAVLLLPMSGSNATLTDVDGYRLVLKRHVNGDSDLYFSVKSAGSAFQIISEELRHKTFCSTKLPRDLCELEFAVIGIYDTDFRKIWLLKGLNDKDEYEFYLDTNGDHCFTDEKPIKSIKKNARFNYEGSSEWVEAEYLKATTLVDYWPEQNEDVDQMAVYLFYNPQKKLIEFSNNEFWLGETEFGGKQYKVALYGGLQSSWFLRPTFDGTPTQVTKNEIRIDFNNNGVFEEMTVYDPETNQVVQERFLLNEPFEVNCKRYEVKSIQRNKDDMVVEIVPYQPQAQSAGTAS